MQWQGTAMLGDGVAGRSEGTATRCKGSARQGKSIDTQRTERQRKAMMEGGLMAQLSRLAKGLRRAYAMSGAPTVADFAAAAGVSYSWLVENMRREDDPLWLRTLRAVKRATGLTWDEILGR